MNIFGRTTVPQGIFAMTETGKQPNAVGGAATSTAPEPQVKTNGKRPRAASPEYGPPSTTSAVRNPPSAFTNCTPAAVPSFGSLGPANLDQQFAKKTKPSSPEYQPEHGAFASQYALFDPRPSFGSKTARPQFAFGAPGFSNPASTKDQQSTALTRVDSHLGSTYGRLTPVAPEPANSQTTVATQTQTLNTAPAFDLRFKVMFKTGHDSDLTVTAEDKSFQVHKVVLCPLSPYFAKTRSPVSSNWQVASTRLSLTPAF